MSDLSCFMAYDIRGKVPEQLDASLAQAIGRAFVAEMGARRVVVGRDVRLESPMLTAALIQGLTGSGADVIDIGLCGTEEVYFGTVHHGADGGIMVTASHNPKGFNGMKLVREGAQPISGDSGLLAIRDRIAAGDLPAMRNGTVADDATVLRIRRQAIFRPCATGPGGRSDGFRASGCRESGRGAGRIRPSCREPGQPCWCGPFC
jgi:phosphomannomutase